MVQSIGKGGSLAREALLAAMKAQAKNAEGVERAAKALDSIASKPADQTAPADALDFADQVREQLQSLDADVRSIDDIPAEMLTGKVEDIHEIAVRVKEAEFRFRFAMEVRNKLLDAYREVMRMNV